MLTMTLLQPLLQLVHQCLTTNKWFDWDDGDGTFSASAPLAKKMTANDNESEEDDGIAAFN
jgi:hypothetical protein